MREGLALGPQWRVARHDADELSLEQHGAPWKKAIGSLVVSAGAGSVGLALALATPTDARLIIWPLSALLLGVAALGLPAAVRNFRRAQLGVRLRFTPGFVEGWPIAVSFSPRKCPAADVARVAVQVFAHPPLTLALLEVTLNDGTRLSGPEVAVGAGQPHPLDGAAAAARVFISADSAAK